MKLIVIIVNDVRMSIQWNPSPGSPRRNRKSVEQWIALLFEKFEKVRVPIFKFFVFSHTNRSSMATWMALLFEQFEKVRLPTPKFLCVFTHKTKFHGHMDELTFWELRKSKALLFQISPGFAHKSDELTFWKSRQRRASCDFNIC